MFIFFNWVFYIYDKITFAQNFEILSLIAKLTSEQCAKFVKNIQKSFQNTPITQYFFTYMHAKNSVLLLHT